MIGPTYQPTCQPGGGGSGGAEVLGTLSVPGRPTNLDNSRARVYCAVGAVFFFFLTFFLSSINSIFFFPLSLGDGPIETCYTASRGH